MKRFFGQQTTVFRLALCRPGNLPAVVVGEIGDVAGVCGRDSGLDGCIWLFATLDAGEKILHMIDGAVAVAACAENRILFSRYAFAVHRKSATMDLERCLRAAEFKAAIVN